MELQRHLMLMYTSCGWFFGELSGLETVQVIQYACRAVQLSQEVLGDQVESGFLQALAQAKSNIPEHQDGAAIYRKFASTRRWIWGNWPRITPSPRYSSHTPSMRASIATPPTGRPQSLEAGRMKLGLGRASFTSEITQESKQLVFAALHFGDHNLQCGTHVFRDEETYRKLVQDMTAAFSRADVPEALRVMDKELGATYSLKSLFRDDRRAILRQILNTSLEEAEAAYRQIYEHHVPLAHFLRDLGVPLPKAIRTAAEFALNSHLRRAFGNEDMDVEQVRKLLEEARRGGIALDSTTLEYALRLTIERLFEEFAAEPGDLAARTPGGDRRYGALPAVRGGSCGPPRMCGRRCAGPFSRNAGGASRRATKKPASGSSTFCRSARSSRCASPRAPRPGANRLKTAIARTSGAAFDLRRSKVAKSVRDDPAHIPSSTYRLQLNRHFTFSQASDLVDYLCALGIGDCYLSPFLMAAAGSLHGYDVTNPARINPEIGTREDLQRFSERLKHHGMGIIADVVPNHMCIDAPTSGGGMFWKTAPVLLLRATSISTGIRPSGIWSTRCCCPFSAISTAAFWKTSRSPSAMSAAGSSPACTKSRSRWRRAPGRSCCSRLWKL